MGDHDVAVLGVGMHPWGKWGRNFVEYGLVAARAALEDAGMEWGDIQFVSGADTIRNGYPGFVSGATFAQALGWQGAPVASSYAACASGATALNAARAQILGGLCDVALVVGADTDVTVPAVVEALRTELAGLEVVTVPGRHVVLWDAYVETADAIGTFLENAGA